MYERFTDRARKIMALAHQEAQRLNHDRLLPAHILLGLVKEGSGVGAMALRYFEVKFHNVRTELEKLVPPGTDPVYVGKLPQAPETKKVIEDAIAEARRLDHNYVGTEHLLLAILLHLEDPACQVLTKLNVELEKAREAVLTLVGAGKEDVPLLSFAQNLNKRLLENLPATKERELLEQVRAYIAGKQTTIKPRYYTIYRPTVSSRFVACYDAAVTEDGRLDDNLFLWLLQNTK
jgi:ATP-dependent Clp protease ATP-binding subunit ClpA